MARRNPRDPILGTARAERLGVMPFEEMAVSHAADIRADPRRRGMPIRGFGVLIAGHASSLGLIVVTGNLGEFRRVDGLRYEDWLGDG